ncbi:hypothetical protein, partial [Paractinoplanes rishiriensis]|uniref:hypothetical protein n=1 Tax=Paractinoplanes rishiriensis TaxID=1050105 RepID=UPI0019425BBE
FLRAARAGCLRAWCGAGPGSRVHAAAERRRLRGLVDAFWTAAGSGVHAAARLRLFAGCGLRADRGECGRFRGAFGGIAGRGEW